MPALKGDGEWPRKEFIYWTDDGSVAALRYNNWKITFLEQKADGLHVWQEPFEELRAPLLTNLRMDPVRARRGRRTQWAISAGISSTCSSSRPRLPMSRQWLQSFREFPPRQKPGSFNLDRVMEAVTAGSQGNQ